MFGVNIHSKNLVSINKHHAHPKSIMTTIIETIDFIISKFTFASELMIEQLINVMASPVLYLAYSVIAVSLFIGDKDGSKRSMMDNGGDFLANLFHYTHLIA